MYNMARIDEMLDSWVVNAHRLKIAGRRYHPYFLASDLAFVLCFLMTWAFTDHYRGVNLSRFIIIFVLVQIAYKLALKGKEAWLGTKSRSLLQDSLFFILPLYAFLNHLFGQSQAASFDLAALFMSLYFGVIRIGCFMGGCCYGAPSRVGVLYPEHIFSAVRGLRNYTPGAFTRERVFPVQLVESAAHLSLFALLIAYLEHVGHPDGLLMPIYFAAYGMVRFGLDFMRRSSARPRWGPFSEAQVVSLFVVVACVLILSIVHVRGGWK